MKPIIAFFALLLATGLHAQTTDSFDQVFITVDQMPEYPGGEKALLAYLSSLPYPPVAKENDIEGSVFVRFVVDKDGSVINAEVAKGTDKILNDAAVQHVQKMPKWKPGMNNGQVVKVQYVVPIKFDLVDEVPAEEKKTE